MNQGIKGRALQSTDYNVDKGMGKVTAYSERCRIKEVLEGGEVNMTLAKDSKDKSGGLCSRRGRLDSTPNIIEKVEI